MICKHVLFIGYVVRKFFLPISIVILAVSVIATHRYQFSTQKITDRAFVIIRFDNFTGEACTLSKAKTFDPIIILGRNTFLPERC